MTRKAEGKGATAMCSHFDQIHRLTRPFAISSIPQHRKTKIALKQRNFDPVTRQPAQHAAGGSGEDLLDGDDQETTAAGETVEKRMEGIAERIVQEDEAKRTQELVSDPSRSRIQLQCTTAIQAEPLSCGTGLAQHSTQTGELGFETGHGQADAQDGQKDSRGIRILVP